MQGTGRYCPIVEKFREYKAEKERVDEAKQMLEEKLDSDFRELVQSEYDEGREKLASLEKELRILLLPKDPNDENVIVEIRAGQAATRPLYLPPIYSECIQCMPSRSAGK